MVRLEVGFLQNTDRVPASFSQSTELEKEDGHVNLKCVYFGIDLRNFGHVFFDC